MVGRRHTRAATPTAARRRRGEVSGREGAGGAEGAQCRAEAPPAEAALRAAEPRGGRGRAQDGVAPPAAGVVVVAGRTPRKLRLFFFFFFVVSDNKQVSFMAFIRDRSL